jgi:hypothetical protein
MFAKTVLRFGVLTVLIGVLIVAVALTGCGGGAKDRRAEVMQLWAAHPASADWDLTIRGVVGQKKSTGEHDASYTIYLTTYSSKKVAGFAAYDTIDIPNEDTMEFANRVNAFFAVINSPSSLFSGVDDVEGFMKWYAADMKGKYFIRLREEVGTSGDSTWTLISTDKEPVASTFTASAGTETPLAFDAATGAWSVK